MLRVQSIASPSSNRDHRHALHTLFPAAGDRDIRAAMTARRPTRQNLLDEFETYGVPRERWLVGAEFERHLLDGSGMPLPYAGKPGIRSTLENLSAHGTWKPYLEEGALIALERPGASVTLEPGGQFELSGSPFPTLDGIEKEAHAFHQEVAAALDGTGVRQVALGHTPYE